MVGYRSECQDLTDKAHALRGAHRAAFRAPEERQRTQRQAHASGGGSLPRPPRTQVGTPMSAKNMTARSFKPLLKRAGLPDIRFHDLRHTFATLMLQNGEHPKVVQEMLGHAMIAITLDTYSHVLPNMQCDAVARLGTLLS